jgi:hypothetical protein
MFLVVGATLIVFNYLYIGQVQTVSQISAVSERVAITVTQPQKAAFYVRDIRFRIPTGNHQGPCEEGMITPALNTRVIYERSGKGPLSVELLPPPQTPNVITAVFTRLKDNQDRNLIGSTYLETDAACDSAHTPPELNLPVWGLVVIGVEYRGANGPAPPLHQFLLEGKLTLSADAVAVPWMHMRPTLYKVAELNLPVGSRLEDCLTPSCEESWRATATRREVNWWGTVSVDASQSALRVDLATDAPRLALYRPGRYRDDPEVIEATILTQAFDDPNLIKIYKWLGVAAGFGALLDWIIGLFARGRVTRDV